MYFLLSLIALLLLIPAALAGIGSGLVEALANLDCLSTALPHASALLAEMAPMAPGIGLLIAGVVTLGLAAWLIVRVVSEG
jgi:hypothetical protein